MVTTVGNEQWFLLQPTNVVGQTCARFSTVDGPRAPLFPRSRRTEARLEETAKDLQEHHGGQDMACQHVCNFNDDIFPVLLFWCFLMVLMVWMALQGKEFQCILYIAWMPRMPYMILYYMLQSYSCPALSHSPDCSLDIFSFGRLSFFVSTGRLPFPHHTIEQVRLDRRCCATEVQVNSISQKNNSLTLASELRSGVKHIFDHFWLDLFVRRILLFFAYPYGWRVGPMKAITRLMRNEFISISKVRLFDLVNEHTDVLLDLFACPSSHLCNPQLVRQYLKVSNAHTDIDENNQFKSLRFWHRQPGIFAPQTIVCFGDCLWALFFVVRMNNKRLTTRNAASLGVSL